MDVNSTRRMSAAPDPLPQLRKDSLNGAELSGTERSGPISHEPGPLAPLSSSAAIEPPASLSTFDQDKADYAAMVKSYAEDLRRRFVPAFDYTLCDTLELLRNLGRFAEALPLAVQANANASQPEVLARSYLQAGRPHQALALASLAAMQATSEGNEPALLLAQTRLLCGYSQAARDALPAESANDAETVALRSMIEHSCGNEAACEAELTKLGKSELRIVVDIWRNRPQEAMTLAAELFADLIERPTVNEQSCQRLKSLLSSPVVLNSPCAHVLSANKTWQLLRDCGGMPAETASIPVLCPLTERQGDGDPPAPRRDQVSLVHVQRALCTMGYAAVSEALEVISSVANPADALHGYVQNFRATTDPRIRSGVVLSGQARMLLANYYQRKLGTSISVHLDVGSSELDDALPAIVAAERLKTGDVRSAHCVGKSHGATAVYVRENGSEAVFVYDSMGLKSDEGAYGMEAMSIPLYVQAVAVQFADAHSCWMHSMKAAVTLTRRVWGQNGMWGTHAIPALIRELELHKVDPDDTGSVREVKLLPELGKTNTDPDLVFSPGELSSVLRDSRKEQPPTLGEFLSASEVVDSESGSVVQDYPRQKGIEYAVNAQIQFWIEMIAAMLGDKAWTTLQQNLFVAELKKLMPQSASRSDPLPLSP